MASNTFTYRGNMFYPGQDGKPLIMPGNFAAGSTATVKGGDILELTANTNVEWVTMDADDTAFAAQIAVAGEEVKASDLAGFYRIIVPRPGDVFEYPVVSAAHKIGDALYWTSTNKLTASAGSNIIARVVGHWQYPYPQNHLADGGVVDKGVTVRSITNVLITFVHGMSYYALFDDLNI